MELYNWMLKIECFGYRDSIIFVLWSVLSIRSFCCRWMEEESQWILCHSHGAVGGRPASQGKGVGRVEACF